MICDRNILLCGIEIRILGEKLQKNTTKTQIDTFVFRKTIDWMKYTSIFTVKSHVTLIVVKISLKDTKSISYLAVVIHCICIS